LIGILTKCGKKTKAIKILDIALNKVCREISIPIDEILNQIVDALKVSVEPRKIKIRRNLHIVPFPINEKRKAFLIAKWLVSKTKKASQSASDKIASEILKILKGEKSESESNREYYVNKSLDNISNIHFRW
jgi:ribosomal protein S7